MTLEDFMIESNAIEGIHDRSRLPEEIEAMESFLDDDLSTESVIRLAMTFQPEAHGHPNGLRTQPGMNVRVGNHFPPRGGPDIEGRFEAVIGVAAENGKHPYLVHQDYETLHPFMDGNGRTGRAVWLWQMREFYRYDYQIGFLHCWYYQALQFHRGT